MSLYFTTFSSQFAIIAAPTATVLIAGFGVLPNRGWQTWTVPSPITYPALRIFVVDFCSKHRPLWQSAHTPYSRQKPGCFPVKLVPCCCDDNDVLFQPVVLLTSESSATVLVRMFFTALCAWPTILSIGSPVHFRKSHESFVVCVGVDRIIGALSSGVFRHFGVPGI